MKILLITKSFEREVSALVAYAAQHAPDVHFHVVLPIQSHAALPAPVSFRKIFCARHMRAACISPGILTDLYAVRPDIVHVFEEFSSLMAFQSIFLRNLMSRSAKTMVYSAENIPGNIHPIFRLPARYVLRHADLAFVCHPQVEAVLRQEGYRKPVEVFPLGVDPTQFHKFSALELKARLQLEGAWVIGYVGRLLAIKRVDLLIESMLRLPEQVHLLIVGSGPEEAALRAMIANYQLERRVHLVGDVAYDLLPQYMNCMDVGIVPSQTTKRWKEQFGRVLIELMSCEVPVVGSDSGSIPEVIGEAGVIFPEKNLEQLVTILEELRRAPRHCQELGTLGRARVLDRYSVTIMCQRFLTMYARLMQQR